MMNNPMQVKARIKNLAKGDSGKAQLLQRRYAMERFLERISKSGYKEYLVLKGGMLVTSMLDVGQRMTRDADVTMLNKTLDITSATEMAKDITSIVLEDGMLFDIEDAYEIMEDSEYGGVRIEMRAHLGKTEIPIKLDISTGDALTPSAINYSYHLMLEDRDIDILAYNVETVLAEKIETMLVRSTFNTRMRDFYDIWALLNIEIDIDYSILAKAIIATAQTRHHAVSLVDAESVIDTLAASKVMVEHWTRYQDKNNFADGITWDEVLNTIRTLFENIAHSNH